MTELLIERLQNESGTEDDRMEVRRSSPAAGDACSGPRNGAGAIRMSQRNRGCRIKGRLTWERKVVLPRNGEVVKLTAGERI